MKIPVFWRCTIFCGVLLLVVSAEYEAAAQENVRINQVTVQQKTALPAAAVNEILQKIQDVSLDAQSGRIYSERATLIDSLGRYGASEAVDLLTRLMQNDPDLFVRIAAARALGNLGDKKAIPALKKGCSDPDVFIRLESGRSLLLLSERKETGAVSTLKEIALGVGSGEWKTHYELEAADSDTLPVPEAVKQKKAEQRARIQAKIHEKNVRRIRIRAMNNLFTLDKSIAGLTLETLAADPDSLIQARAARMLEFPRFKRK